MDVLRARHELPSELSRTSTAGLSDEVERRSDLRELVDDVGRLPEDQRIALVLSEVEDLTHADVAEVVGCAAPQPELPSPDGGALPEVPLDVEPPAGVR